MIKLPQKFIDFFFSFGMMFIGLFLLFIFSVTIENKIEKNLFPSSSVRKENNFLEKAIDKFPVSKPAWPMQKNNNFFSGTSTAVSFLIIDVQTDKQLFEKNSQQVRSLASITKLMSAMVLLDLPINWSSSTQILDIDCDSFSHQVQAGDILKLSDLWNVALVGSANNAIKALVRNSGVSSEEFVLLMNEKAKELNLKSMSFTEPTGLGSGNVGNARDVAGLLKEALKSEKIFKSLQIGQYSTKPLNSQKPRQVYSTNWLLTNWMPNKFSIDKIVGKTGFIYDSGYNFVVRLADNKDHQIIVVVLGAQNNESRFSEARDLADWIFKQYLWPDEEGYSDLVK